MKQPESNIIFECYEDGSNFLGLTQVTLPNIAFLIQQINGAGINGNIDAPILGMMEAMELSLNFRSPTDAAASLVEPRAHNLDLRVAAQYWDTTNAGYGVEADKYVLVVRPKAMNPGNVQPATAADTSSTYSVNYYAGYRDGQQLWEIDPMNYICKINGKDYFADVRTALGK